MNKIISYSLWGNDPKYKIGAIRNIELAKIYFPEWKVRLYLSEKTEFDYVSDNLEIVFRLEKTPQDGCFWRFEACDSNDIVIVRDLDDRLSSRHRFVVDEWIKSDKNIHIIKDHPNHTFPIMAGLWGSRNGKLIGICDLINQWPNKSYYTTDQDFLTNHVWNTMSDDAYVNDAFNKGESFDINIDRKDYEFMGDSFDQFDNRANYWEVIRNYNR